jgi:hypothetical protein
MRAWRAALSELGGMSELHELQNGMLDPIGLRLALQ